MPGGTGRDQSRREVGQVREPLELSTVPPVCQALCGGYIDEQNQVCHWQEPMIECGMIEGGLCCDRSTAWKVTSKEGFMEEVPFVLSSN